MKRRSNYTADRVVVCQTKIVTTPRLAWLKVGSVASASAARPDSYRPFKLHGILGACHYCSDTIAEDAEVVSETLAAHARYFQVLVILRRCP